VNLADGQKFQIAMRPTANQDRVIPDAFRIALHNYLGKPEVMRESKLSQTPVSNAINGKPVRRQTLSIIREAAAKIQRE
jgi:hypothetical protein